MPREAPSPHIFWIDLSTDLLQEAAKVLRGLPQNILFIVYHKEKKTASSVYWRRASLPPIGFFLAKKKSCLS